LPVRIIRSEQNNRDKNPIYCIFPEDSLDNLKQECLVKIRQGSKNENFKNHPQLLDILIVWKSWGKADEFSTWAEQSITDKQSVLTLLNIFFQNYKEDDILGNRIQMESIGLIQWFSISDFLEKKIQKLGLKDEDNLLVALFHKGLKMKLEGGGTSSSSESGAPT
jgi:predicted KAP-like P-loop ATPase